MDVGELLSVIITLLFMCNKYQLIEINKCTTIDNSKGNCCGKTNSISFLKNLVNLKNQGIRQYFLFILTY